MALQLPLEVYQQKQLSVSRMPEESSGHLPLRLGREQQAPDPSSVGTELGVLRVCYCVVTVICRRSYPWLFILP